jgi:hypothetical protein
MPRKIGALHVTRIKRPFVNGAHIHFKGKVRIEVTSYWGDSINIRVYRKNKCISDARVYIK